MSELNKQNSIAQNGNPSVDEHSYDRNNAYCYFQVPVMLTPAEIIKLQKVIDDEKKNLQSLWSMILLHISNKSHFYFKYFGHFCF